MKLLILLALFGLTAAAVYQHQLVRVESKKSRMKKEGTWEAYKKAKDLLNPHFKTDSQPMNDYDDVEYLSNVTVGTPPQSFLIVLDTGSSDFWIPDSSCGASDACPSVCSLGLTCPLVCDKSCCNGKSTILEDDQVCMGKVMFYSNESSTYVAIGTKWEIEYGSGSCSGFLGEDTVRLGNADENQLVVPKSAVGQATQLSPDFKNDPMDGILGLAFPSIDSEKADPILFNAYKQGLLDKPIFTVYLKERGLEVNVPGGAITYGGIDTEHCSPKVDYVDLSSALWYEFKMDSFSMGSAKSSDGWQVISDTGTTMIIAPTDVYTQLAEAAGVNDDHTIDCSAKFDDLKLTIGGKEYTIPAKQLILHEPNGDCVFAVDGMDMGEGNPQWILGDPWLRSYCNVYGFQDKNIGFSEIIA